MAFGAGIAAGKKDGHSREDHFVVDLHAQAGGLALGDAIHAHRLDQIVDRTARNTLNEAWSRQKLSTADAALEKLPRASLIRGTSVDRCQTRVQAGTSCYISGTPRRHHTVNMASVKQLGVMKMSLGLWQLREVKRALIIFCDDNKLELGDAVALKAAQELLEAAQQCSGTSDQLLRHLRTQNTDMSEPSTQSEPVR